MTDWIAVVAIIAGFVLLLASGIEIAFALGIVALAGIFLVSGGIGMTSATVAWDSTDSFVLTAVPLFILMGELLGRSRVVSDLYDAATAWLGRLPGSLALTSTVVCGLHAAVAGSSVATAASVGRVAFPEMQRRKYSKRLSTGVLAGGGTLGILIPPSIPFVIYGYITETSVGKLFTAGIIPGILVMGLFSIYVAAVSILFPGIAPRDPNPINWRQRFQALLKIVPFAVLVALVLGVIYGGVATPTEAGAIGVVGVLAVSLIHRDLSLGVIREALITTARIASMIIFILIGASALSYFLTLTRVPMAMAETINAMGLSSWQFLILICVLFLILGCFFDVLSALIIVIPFLIPTMLGFGYDLVWFGVIAVIFNELGLVTPPFGMNLFVIQSVTNVHLDDVIMGTLPFVVILLVALALILAFPQLALWLPAYVK